jgi:hypothetical protein
MDEVRPPYPKSADKLLAFEAYEVDGMAYHHTILRIPRKPNDI